MVGRFLLHCSTHASFRYTTLLHIVWPFLWGCRLACHIVSCFACRLHLQSGCLGLLLPEQVAELLPWYMQWSRDLASEMHHRRLVRNEARRTDPFPSSYRECGCTSEWQCEPHDTCFIHDSCFCPGSGSFPSVKPPHT